MKQLKRPKRQRTIRLPEIVLQAAEEVDVSLIHFWRRLRLRERLRACASGQRLARRFGNGPESAQ